MARNRDTGSSEKRGLPNANRPGLQRSSTSGALTSRINPTLRTEQRKVNVVLPDIGNRDSVSENITVQMNELSFTIPLTQKSIKFSAFLFKLAAASELPFVQLQGKPFLCEGCRRHLQFSKEDDQLLPVECCAKRSLVLKEQPPPPYMPPGAEAPNEGLLTFFLTIALPEEEPFAFEVKSSDTLSSVLSRAQQTCKHPFFRIADVTSPGIPSLLATWGSNWDRRTLAECRITSSRTLSVSGASPASIFAVVISAVSPEARVVQEVPLPEMAKAKGVLEALASAGIVLKQPLVMTQLGAIYRRDGYTKRAICSARSDFSWGFFDEVPDAEGEVEEFERSHDLKEFLHASSPLRSAPRKPPFLHILEDAELLTLRDGTEVEALPAADLEDRNLLAMMKGFRARGELLFDLYGGALLLGAENRVFSDQRSAMAALVSSEADAAEWRRIFVFLRAGAALPNVRPPPGSQLRLWKRWGHEVLVKSGRVVAGAPGRGNYDGEEERRGSAWVDAITLSRATTDFLSRAV